MALPSGPRFLCTGILSLVACLTSVADLVALDYAAQRQQEVTVRERRSLS
jgi:hypothetical protein